MATDSHWNNLPQPLQLEIFTFLSVKHLTKLHSLNKATSQQLDESEYYWKELAVNYARKIDPDLINQIKTLPTDQSSSPQEKFSKHFKSLIKAKMVKIEILRNKREELQLRNQMEILRSRMLKSSKLESTNVVVKETENDNFNKEIEKLQFD